jgi:glycosyltransferase involved in cell wall biosynthesis
MATSDPTLVGAHASRGLTPGPLRILVLAPHPFYLDRGTPIDVDLVLAGLSERGDHVDVLTYHVGSNRTYPNVRVHRIPSFARIADVPPGLSARKLLCDVRLLRAAWRLVRQNDYHVVHADEEAVLIAMLFKRLYGIPYVYDMDSSIAQQTVDTLPVLRPFSPVLDWIEGRAIRGSLAVAPVCNALADLARRRGAPFVETLHDISQLGTDDFEPVVDLRRRLGISGLILMYVGNLEPYQGIDLLLESVALARHEAETFDLVVAGGEPEDIAIYERKARTLGIGDRTHFIGPWPFHQVGPLLAEADILAAPRIRGINTPMKVFPYLHSGKPVIVTDLITHNQILDDSVACLAPADPEGFSQAIVRLTGDAGLRRRLGSAGRAFVEQEHTREAYRKRLNRLYDYVAQARLPKERASAGDRVPTAPH